MSYDLYSFLMNSAVSSVCCVQICAALNSISSSESLPPEPASLLLSGAAAIATPHAAPMRAGSDAALPAIAAASLAEPEESSSRGWPGWCYPGLQSVPNVATISARSGTDALQTKQATQMWTPRELVASSLPTSPAFDPATGRWVRGGTACIAERLHHDNEPPSTMRKEALTTQLQPSGVAVGAEAGTSETEAAHDGAARAHCAVMATGAQRSANADTSMPIDSVPVSGSTQQLRGTGALSLADLSAVDIGEAARATSAAAGVAVEAAAVPSVVLDGSWVCAEGECVQTGGWQLRDEPPAASAGKAGGIDDSTLSYMVDASMWGAVPGALETSAAALQAPPPRAFEPQADARLGLSAAHMDVSDAVNDSAAAGVCTASSGAVVGNTRTLHAAASAAAALPDSAQQLARCCTAVGAVAADVMFEVREDGAAPAQAAASGDTLSAERAAQEGTAACAVLPLDAATVVNGSFGCIAGVGTRTGTVAAADSAIAADAAVLQHAHSRAASSVNLIELSVGESTLSTLAGGAITSHVLTEHGRQAAVLPPAPVHSGKLEGATFASARTARATPPLSDVSAPGLPQGGHNPSSPPGTTPNEPHADRTGVLQAGNAGLDRTTTSGIAHFGKIQLGTPLLPSTWHVGLDDAGSWRIGAPSQHPLGNDRPHLGTAPSTQRLTPGAHMAAATGEQRRALNGAAQQNSAALASTSQRLTQPKYRLHRLQPGSVSAQRVSFLTSAQLDNAHSAGCVTAPVAMGVLHHSTTRLRREDAAGPMQSGRETGEVYPRVEQHAPYDAASRLDLFAHNPGWLLATARSARRAELRAAARRILLPDVSVALHDGGGERRWAVDVAGAQAADTIAAMFESHQQHRAAAKRLTVPQSALHAPRLATAALR